MISLYEFEQVLSIISKCVRLPWLLDGTEFPGAEKGIDREILRRLHNDKEICPKGLRMPAKSLYNTKRYVDLVWTCVAPVLMVQLNTCNPVHRDKKFFQTRLSANERQMLSAFLVPDFQSYEDCVIFSYSEKLLNMFITMIASSYALTMYTYPKVIEFADVVNAYTHDSPWTSDLTLSDIIDPGLLFVRGSLERFRGQESMSGSAKSLFMRRRREGKVTVFTVCPAHESEIMENLLNNDCFDHDIFKAFVLSMLGANSSMLNVFLGDSALIKAVMCKDKERVLL